jgi:phosphoribosylglycinamide formyltransferase-1
VARKTAILISGRGSNMKALLDAAEKPDYPAEIVLVVSNRPKAAGLAAAAERGIATFTLDHSTFEGREEFEDELDAVLKKAGVELICLAGFMRLLTDGFVKRWHDRLINIHPSLLPAFKGMDTHARALAAGVKITGCSVHFVREEMDSGPIIAQAAVPVLDDDDEERLAARVLEAEHRLYPLALALVASGRARAVGGRVVIEKGAKNARTPLISPAPETAGNPT